MSFDGEENNGLVRKVLVGGSVLAILIGAGLFAIRNFKANVSYSYNGYLIGIPVNHNGIQRDAIEQLRARGYNVGETPRIIFKYSNQNNQ